MAELTPLSLPVKCITFDFRLFLLCFALQSIQAVMQSMRYIMLFLLHFVFSESIHVVQKDTTRSSSVGSVRLCSLLVRYSLEVC